MNRNGRKGYRTYKMVGWMDGWMDGWVDGWVDGLKETEDTET